MTWLRVGDTSWTDPKVQALADPQDPRMLREAFGFLVLLGTLSAQHQTDYLIDQATAAMVGGERTDLLLRTCARAGLVEVTGRGRARRWRIVENDEVLHIRLRDAVQWERQQRSDTGSERYRVACYLRDGDACRWCGKVVQPNDNRSGRGRTLDHLLPGKPAGSPDGLVVACRACNGARGQDWQDEGNRAGFATRWPLREPPTHPYWAPSTVTWLAERGHHVTPAPRPASSPTTPETEEPHHAPQASAPAAAPAAQEEEPHHATQACAPATTQAPPALAATGTQPAASHERPEEEPHRATQACAPAAPDSTTSDRPSRPAPATRPTPGHSHPATTADRSATARSGTAGPGRVGTGRAGSGAAPHPPAQSTSPAAPRRGRGRRRPRSTGGSQ